MTDTKKTLLETLRENSKKQGGRRFKNREYQIKEDGDVTQKLSPQAIKCLEILFENGENPISEQDAFNLFEGADFGKSKQNGWKIFQYYRKSLIDAGFLEIVDKKAS